MERAKMHFVIAGALWPSIIKSGKNSDMKNFIEYIKI